MRVLNIMSRFNVGGTSQWLLQLSDGLTASQIDNLLVIGFCPEGETEDLRLASVPHKRIHGLGPKMSPLATVSAFITLRRLIKEYQPDVINTHTSKAGVLGRLAAITQKSRPTIVHTYHGHVLSGYFNPIFEILIRLIETFLSRFTDYFMVSGVQVLDDIKRAKIIRKGNVINIWPAVPDLELENRDKSRSELKIKKNDVVIGWLGRKVPIKRIDRILDLAALHPLVKFVISGDGESIYKTFHDRFRASQLDNVIELGFTTPSKLWAISDICIITSDNEAMPISPIEASLAGKPVIGVDAGATKEVLIDGKTGILCKRDIQDLSRAIDQLVSDLELRERLGSQARKFALQQFSPSSSIHRQVEGYQLAINYRLRKTNS